MNLWKSDLDPGRIFSMGVVASALATVITYPIQVLQMNSRVMCKSDIFYKEKERVFNLHLIRSMDTSLDI